MNFYFRRYLASKYVRTQTKKHKILNSRLMCMPNITLSIPDDIYRKMKKYSEIKWSEVVRKAIVDYLRKLEENRSEISTKELLDELGNAFKKSLDELNLETVLKGYKKMRESEWKRVSTTQAN